MSAAQNYGQALFIGGADGACSHAAKFNDLSQLLKFPPSIGEANQEIYKLKDT